MTNDDRIESLEKQVRTLIWILFGLLVLVLFIGGVSLFKVSPATSKVNQLELEGLADVIRAKRIEVVNDAGVVVTSIQSNTQGYGGVYVADRFGNYSASLLATNEGGSVLIVGGDGNSGAGLYIDENGPLLTIENDEYQLVAIGAGIDGGEIAIATNDGNEVAKIMGDLDGGAFVIKDGKGKLRSYWSAIEGGVEMAFLDPKSEKDRLLIQSSPSNGATLSLMNKYGLPVASLMADQELGQGAIFILNRKAEILFSVP